MRLSVLAATAGFAASTVAHPLSGAEHEPKHKTPKVLGGIIDESIVVVPTHSDMITPQSHKGNGQKHGSSGPGPIFIKKANGTLEYLSTEPEGNHHGKKKQHGGSSSARVIENEDGTLSYVVVETEGEKKHHGHKKQYGPGGSSSAQLIESAKETVTVNETEGEKQNGKVKSDGAGRLPGSPLYVDIGTSISTEPPLFSENKYLTRREVEIFHDLTKGIIEGQKALKECVPAMVPSCEVSLEKWNKLSELIPDYKVLRQIHYVDACNALRTSLESLGAAETKHNPKIKAILWKLLLDNLLLAGYLDEVYEGTIIPNYSLDPPGEVIGALIHFIGIDVTKALNFWPAFTPYLYNE